MLLPIATAQDVIIHTAIHCIFRTWIHWATTIWTLCSTIIWIHWATTHLTALVTHHMTLPATVTHRLIAPAVTTAAHTAQAVRVVVTTAVTKNL
jgi:hypothetical protein